MENMINGLIDINALESFTTIYKELSKYRDLGCKGVVLGLSGGKDSTVVAMLAKLIWGDNVLGVIMPNKSRDGVEDARTIAKYLDLETREVCISDAYDNIVSVGASDAAAINIAPRLRMTVLYTIAQTLGYRVIGTGNRSERFIGWCTKFGDMACDINPIAHLTCTEVIHMGACICNFFGLPTKYVNIPPADGLTGRTDEENFGFTYEQLDNFLLKGSSGDPVLDKRIIGMHDRARHKLQMPITFEK